VRLTKQHFQDKFKKTITV